MPNSRRGHSGSAMSVGGRCDNSCVNVQRRCRARVPSCQAASFLYISEQSARLKSAYADRHLGKGGVASLPLGHTLEIEIEARD